MELRHYARILRRSWLLLVSLPALVAALTLALALILPRSYVITAAMLVTQRPIAVAPADLSLPDYNLYHSWAASEFIVDDIIGLVETRDFARDIAAWIEQRDGRQLDPERISAGLEAERQHRMIYLHVVASRPDDAQLIAQGAVAMLSDNGLKYWARADTASLQVSRLELPDEAEPARGPLRLVLDIVLRSSLALLLAIGLAFLRHYLDQSVHQRDEVEALGLEVVGQIPTDQGQQAVPLPKSSPQRARLGTARRP